MPIPLKTFGTSLKIYRNIEMSNHFSLCKAFCPSSSKTLSIALHMCKYMHTGVENKGEGKLLVFSRCLHTYLYTKFGVSLENAMHDRDNMIRGGGVGGKSTFWGIEGVPIYI